MTRKRYIKLLMANGWSRNDAENTAGLGLTNSNQTGRVRLMSSSGRKLYHIVVAGHIVHMWKRMIT